MECSSIALFLYFGCFQSFDQNPWLVHLAIKLLANDQDAVSLIAYNPFAGKQPPKWVGIEKRKQKSWSYFVREKLA